MALLHPVLHPLQHPPRPLLPPLKLPIEQAWQHPLRIRMLLIKHRALPPFLSAHLNRLLQQSSPHPFPRYRLSTVHAQITPVIFTFFSPAGTGTPRNTTTPIILSPNFVTRISCSSPCPRSLGLVRLGNSHSPFPTLSASSIYPPVNPLTTNNPAITHPALVVPMSGRSEESVYSAL